SPGILHNRRICERSARQILGDRPMRASLIGMIVALFALPARAQEAPPDFQPLWNGKDLSGWQFLNCEKEDWLIKDCVLSTLKDGPRKNQWLLTERYFDDFELRLEFLLTKGAASGLTIRAVGGNPQVDSIKIHLGDDAAFPGVAPYYTCGALWEVR